MAETMNRVDYMKRTEDKATIFKELDGDVVVGSYDHFKNAETVKDYFKNIHSKCQISTTREAGRLVYHVVMPFIENKVTRMKFISAMVDRRMRWGHWRA